MYLIDSVLDGVKRLSGRPRSAPKLGSLTFLPRILGQIKRIIGRLFMI